MDNFTIVSFLHLFMKVCLTCGLIGFVIIMGERALGFDVRKLIDDIEKESEKGNVWPGTALLLGGMLSLAYFFG